MAKTHHEDLADLAASLQEWDPRPITGTRIKLSESPSATARRLMSGDHGDLPEGLLEASNSQRERVIVEAERLAGVQRISDARVMTVPTKHCGQSLVDISLSLGVPAEVFEHEGRKVFVRPVLEGVGR